MNSGDEENALADMGWKFVKKIDKKIWAIMPVSQAFLFSVVLLLVCFEPLKSSLLDL